MKKRTASLALVTTLGLGTVGVALTPALADSAPGHRVTRFTDALKGLVSDGTLTQAQADKVATTLDTQLPKGPPGGRGHGKGLKLGKVAEALGITPAEVRTALMSGTSLADLAKSKGISRDALVTALLGDRKADLAEEVTAGELTQAQADARLAEARTRIGDLVDRKGLPRRGPKHGDRQG